MSLSNWSDFGIGDLTESMSMGAAKGRLLAWGISSQGLNEVVGA